MGTDYHPPRSGYYWNNHDDGRTQSAGVSRFTAFSDRVHKSAQQWRLVFGSFWLQLVSCEPNFARHVCVCVVFVSHRAVFLHILRLVESKSAVVGFDADFASRHGGKCRLFDVAQLLLVCGGPIQNLLCRCVSGSTNSKRKEKQKGMIDYASSNTVTKKKSTIERIVFNVFLIINPFDVHCCWCFLNSWRLTRVCRQTLFEIIMNHE